MLSDDDDDVKEQASQLSPITGEKSFLSDFVLSWVKGGNHYAAYRSETKISVRHLLF